MPAKISRIFHLRTQSSQQNTDKGGCVFLLAPDPCDFAANIRSSAVQM